MQEQFVRTAMLLGEDKVEALAAKRVAIFGLGGVGGNVADALARCGIGHFTLVDNDQVALSNVNRQLIANLDTVGKDKVDVMEAHILSINRSAEIQKHKLFYLPQTTPVIDFGAFDYVIDAIDTVSAKIDIAVRCKERGTPLISAMGCGNKLDPTKLRVADLYDTQTDPLAKVMRRELRRRGVDHLKVVYSIEPPHTPTVVNATQEDTGTKRRATPSSCAFVPPAAGILIAAEVVKDLLQKD